MHTIPIVIGHVICMKNIDLVTEYFGDIVNTVAWDKTFSRGVCCATLEFCIFRQSQPRLDTTRRIVRVSSVFGSTVQNWATFGFCVFRQAGYSGDESGLFFVVCWPVFAGTRILDDSAEFMLKLF